VSLFSLLQVSIFLLFCRGFERSVNESLFSQQMQQMRAQMSGMMPQQLMIIPQQQVGDFPYYYYYYYFLFLFD